MIIIPCWVADFTPENMATNKLVIQKKTDKNKPQIKLRNKIKKLKNYILHLNSTHTSGNVIVSMRKLIEEICELTTDVEKK